MKISFKISPATPSTGKIKTILHHWSGQLKVGSLTYEIGHPEAPDMILDEMKNYPYRDENILIITDVRNLTTPHWPGIGASLIYKAGVLAQSSGLRRMYVTG